MTTVADLAQSLQNVLTEMADEAAHTSGFVQRQSKLTGAAFVQAVVFGWLANPHATVDALAQAAATVGVAITPQGLDQRFTEAGALCLKRVLEGAVQAVVTTDPVAIPLLERFTAVLMLDSSTIVLPEALAPCWPGCGGTTTARTTAALKLGVRLDVCTGTLTGPLLLDARDHDSGTPLQRIPVPAGSLRIGDLGFFDLRVFEEIGASGAYWLSRLRVTTSVYDQDGQRWDALALLTAQRAPTLDCPIGVGGHRLPARLLGVRVPAGVANQRRRRIRAEAKRRGRTPSAAQLAWADWTILITNVPPEMLSLQEALVLLRARWQIELLFKLWKSHGAIDTSRSAKPWRILCEVYAKLLAMLIQHWLLLTGCWSYPERSLVKAAQTVRQQALHLASVLPSLPRLCDAIAVIYRCLAAGCRLDTRKKRPSTAQLLLNPSLGGLA